jgi:hypothetical protein
VIRVNRQNRANALKGDVARCYAEIAQYRELWRLGSNPVRVAIKFHSEIVSNGLGLKRTAAGVKTPFRLVETFGSISVIAVFWTFLKYSTRKHERVKWSENSADGCIIS